MAEVATTITTTHRGFGLHRSDVARAPDSVAQAKVSPRDESRKHPAFSLSRTDVPNKVVRVQKCQLLQDVLDRGVVPGFLWQRPRRQKLLEQIVAPSHGLCSESYIARVNETLYQC